MALKTLTTMAVGLRERIRDQVRRALCGHVSNKSKERREKRKMLLFGGFVVMPTEKTASNEVELLSVWTDTLT